MVDAALGSGRFRDVPFDRQIRLAYDHLEALRQLNGGYIASPYSGDAGYDRYLACAQRSSRKETLTAAEFYVEQLNRKYSRPNRCC